MKKNRLLQNSNFIAQPLKILKSIDYFEVIQAKTRSEFGFSFV
jgi:hypothetical protein